MLTIDDTRLSEDQKQLVKAFNTVALHFSERILGRIKGILNTDLDLGALIQDYKGEQVTSLIAEEAIHILREMGIDNAVEYLDSIKNGGTVAENRYYVEETLIHSNKIHREASAEACRLNIIKQLLIAASGFKSLPHDYIRDEAQKIGFVP